MSKIEKMQRYINLTGVKYSPHCWEMMLSETRELLIYAQEDPVKALFLAFDYGRAKGERHARKELKKA